MLKYAKKEPSVFLIKPFFPLNMLFVSQVSGCFGVFTNDYTKIPSRHCNKFLECSRMFHRSSYYKVNMTCYTIVDGEISQRIQITLVIKPNC